MMCLKMRVESPFSEKSSARSILTRARGLEILTFDKIRKKVIDCICCHFVLCLSFFCDKTVFLFSSFFAVGTYFVRYLNVCFSYKVYVGTWQTTF